MIFHSVGQFDIQTLANRFTDHTLVDVTLLLRYVSVRDDSGFHSRNIYLCVVKQHPKYLLTHIGLTKSIVHYTLLHLVALLGITC